MINIQSSKPNVIEKKIIAALRRVDSNYLKIGKKKSRWTHALKKEIGNVGKRLGFEVYASGCKFDGEWLFDLTWCKEQGSITLNLPLVMESEWDDNDILTDFTKLVVARAQHRLMIFQGHTTQKVQKTIQCMLSQVRKFRDSGKGDRYLFCYWTKKPDKFMFDLYVVRKA